MQRKRFWSLLNVAGYFVIWAGIFLVIATWVADRAAPPGSLLFNLETVGLILALAGSMMAAAGGLALGHIWPYGPIK